PASQIQPGRPGPEQEPDALLLVPLRWSQRQVIEPGLVQQRRLRQRRPVVRQRLFAADQDDLAGVTPFPQGLNRVNSRQRGADDDHSPHVSGSSILIAPAGQPRIEASARARSWSSSVACFSTAVSVFSSKSPISGASMRQLAYPWHFPASKTTLNAIPTLPSLGHLWRRARDQ